MAKPKIPDELACPTCDAEIPLAGDESVGDEVVCLYCGAPCKVIARGDDEDWDLEEDY